MTSSPNGLGLLEREVLLSLHELDARPREGSVVDERGRYDYCLPSAQVAEALSRRRAINPRYASEALRSLAQDWWSPLALVDTFGNWGNADDPEWAGATFTWVALSHFGYVAALAEAELGPPLPLGLILGNFSAGGTCPPFHPSRVCEALLAADRMDAGDSKMGEAALDMLGLPHFPTCEVEGNVADLHAGKPVSLKLTAPISIGPDQTLHVHGYTPPGGPMTTADSIRHATSHSPTPVSRQDGPDSVSSSDKTRFYGPPGSLPITAVTNRTYRGGTTDLEIQLHQDANPDEVVTSLKGLWPITAEMNADLGAPWLELARQWLDQFHLQNLAGVDLETHLRSHLTPSS